MMNLIKKTIWENRSVLFLILLIFIAASFPRIVLSQSQNTAHTLKLDNPENMPAATINDVGWIAGHYKGEMFDGIAEEVWLPPFGGTMMGMYKHVSNDAVTFYEFLTIVEESNSLILKFKHFQPDLTGWEEKDEFISWPLVKLTKDAIFFDGMTFQKIDQNTIQIYLAINNGGEISETEFKYHRVKR